MNIIFAAIDGSSALKQILVLLVVGIVLGIIAWLIDSAPFINDFFKKALKWLIIFVAALIVINFLLGLIDHPLIRF